jgi:hypothetical protein
MTADPSKFYDALNAAGFEYAALSTGGINLFGDSKSIDTAKRWMHEAEQVAWLKSEIVRLQSELKRAAITAG